MNEAIRTTIRKACIFKRTNERVGRREFQIIYPSPTGLSITNCVALRQLQFQSFSHSQSKLFVFTDATPPLHTPTGLSPFFHVTLQVCSSSFPPRLQTALHLSVHADVATPCLSRYRFVVFLAFNLVSPRTKWRHRGSYRHSLRIQQLTTIRRLVVLAIVNRSQCYIHLFRSWPFSFVSF